MIAPDELERYFQQRTEQDDFSGVVYGNFYSPGVLPLKRKLAAYVRIRH
jgi:hypothetical protein